LVLGQPGVLAAKLREFAGKLIKERRRSSRAYRKAPQVMAHSEEQAKRWLADGLKAAGLRPGDLPGLTGSDPRKLALAELLWKRTTVSQERIAEKLSMRSAANVSQQLRRFNRAEMNALLPAEMQNLLK
jgi:putative transposase